MKHSPEPWVLHRNSSVKKCGGVTEIKTLTGASFYPSKTNPEYVAIVGTPEPGDEDILPILADNAHYYAAGSSPEDMERIVACVNALAGIEEVENKVALWKAFERGATAELDKAVELDAAVQELIDAAKALYPRVPQNDMDDEDFPLMGRIAAAILKLDPTWGVP